MKQEKMKPALRHRYEFIEFQLLWEGVIGRQLLKDKFGISLQQATLDLTSYLDLAPKNMEYDPRQRTYVARTSFSPAFVKGDASEYLVHLEMLHQGYRAISEIWPSTIPAFDAVSVCNRKTDAKVLQNVLRAIREERSAEVTYVSLSSDSEKPRELFPRAIANDGHRWHMRAYDASKERFSDFVLSRIEKISVKDGESIDVPRDEAWETCATLQLCPSPNLNERQKRQVEIEYDMIDGKMTVEVRKAMLFYYLRFYGFDPYELEDGKIRNKSSFALSIVNLDEVEECIGRRK